MSAEEEVSEAAAAAASGVVSDETNHFQVLFDRCLPHILETIFLSLEPQVSSNKNRACVYKEHKICFH